MKIISFALFGNDLKYSHGGIENTYLQQKYYPSWRCRFYYDKSVPETIIKQLADLGAEVILKNDYKDCTRMFWRFECFKDRSIERFIVRDADSRLNPREADAVEKWIKSEKEFHIIRDNGQHTARILGGLFGANASCIAKIADQYDKMLKEHFASGQHITQKHNIRGKYFSSDQDFLGGYIWPLIEHNHLAHVCSLNLKFKDDDEMLEVELPNGEFCGQVSRDYSFLNGDYT